MNGNQPDMTKACDCGHPDPTSQLGHTLDCAVWRWLTAPSEPCSCGTPDAHTVWCKSRGADAEEMTWENCGLDLVSQQVLRNVAAMYPGSPSAECVASLDAKRAAAQRKEESDE